MTVFAGYDRTSILPPEPEIFHGNFFDDQDMAAFCAALVLARHLGAGRLLATDRRVARPAGEQARLRSQMTHHRLAATERAFQRLSPGESVSHRDSPGLETLKSRSVAASRWCIIWERSRACSPAGRATRLSLASKAPPDVSLDQRRAESRHVLVVEEFPWKISGSGGRMEVRS